MNRLKDILQQQRNKSFVGRQKEIFFFESVLQEAEPSIHLIYIHAYQEVRKEGEEYCLNKNPACTFIRPWYVLGPGHWWPVLLLPVYGLAEIIPSWRMKARSMALVTIRQMLNALTYAAESEPTPIRILEIKDIRNIEGKKNAITKTFSQKPSYV